MQEGAHWETEAAEIEGRQEEKAQSKVEEEEAGVNRPQLSGG